MQASLVTWRMSQEPVAVLKPHHTGWPSRTLKGFPDDQTWCMSRKINILKTSIACKFLVMRVGKSCTCRCTDAPWVHHLPMLLSNVGTHHLCTIQSPSHGQCLCQYSDDTPWPRLQCQQDVQAYRAPLAFVPPLQLVLALPGLVGGQARPCPGPVQPVLCPAGHFGDQRSVGSLLLRRTRAEGPLRQDPPHCVPS